MIKCIFILSPVLHNRGLGNFDFGTLVSKGSWSNFSLEKQAKKYVHDWITYIYRTHTKEGPLYGISAHPPLWAQFPTKV